MADEVLYIRATSGEELALRMTEAKQAYFTYASTIKVLHIENRNGGYETHFHAFMYHKGKRP